MLALFLGTGIYFTLLTRGLQFRRLWDIIRAPFKSDGGRGGSISAFSAVSGALAGTLGIGNIVGVAGAVMLGGPGAVFWMVASAFLCMILKYAESALAVRYRTKNPAGETVGGPMYYMRDGLGLRLMPAVFCALCVATALFGAGNVTQIGTISHAVEDTFHIHGLWVSAACALVILLMTGGSVRRLGKVFTFLTPVMSVAFMASAAAALAINADRLPGVFALILEGAFTPRAAVSGLGGYTLVAGMKYGVARGVFSNEAGLGSSPIIHAASDNTPARQGMCGAFEVFFDTVVMAVLTALVILVSGADFHSGAATALTVASFEPVFGRFSGPALTVMLTVFAVSSVPCWYFYGEKCVEYLFPRARRARGVYRTVFFALMAISPLIELGGLWLLADTLNGLMAVPNLTAVVMLSREVASLTAADDARRAMGRYTSKKDARFRRGEGSGVTEGGRRARGR